MASNSLAAQYGSVGWGNQCLGVEIEVAKELTDVDPVGVGLGFFFGLLAGAIIGLLCGKLCLKDFARSKFQDEENTYAFENGYANHERNQLLLLGAPPDKKPNRMAMKRRRKRNERGEILVPNIYISLAAPVPVVVEDPMAPEPGYYSTASGSTGLASALVQTNPDAMDAEMAKQDLEAVDALDRELREEGINTMIQILRVMLLKLMSKGQISEDEYKEIVMRMQNSINTVVEQCQREREMEEQELKRKSSKNPEELENEKEKLNSKYHNRLNSLLKDEKERLRFDLSKSTRMTEDEVDAVLAAYTDHQAALEKRLGAERARMVAALEDRLARRKALAEAHNYKTEQETHEIEFRKDTHNKALLALVGDGKMTERQKDEILDKFENDLRQLQMKQRQYIQEHKITLADKLKQRRDGQQKKLEAQQEREKEDFFQKVDQATSTSDVAEWFHGMLVEHRIGRDDLCNELDTQEADAFERLHKDNEKKRVEEISRKEDELQETLQSHYQLSPRDIDKMIRVHEAEMEQFNRMRKVERKKMNARLEEKLEQRRLRAEEEQASTAAEALALKEQQDATIKRVLDSQLELDEEARDRILKEHEQNIQAVTNQLQMSKLRQQKALEKKLASRRAKVTDLRQKQEEVEINAKSEGKDGKKQVAELQKQIDSEEVQLENDKKNELNELRQRLSAETEEALGEQERQIGLLIGRLEVGAARRQAIIQRQNQTIKELEDQMAHKVNEGGGAQKDWQVDHLIHQHNNQMENLNDKLMEARERQEQVLTEKLQAKKLRKEREVERSLEREAYKEQEDRRVSSAGLATSILTNLMLEQRHKAAMKDLEREMQLEMTRQREELNRELEEELQRELEEQKKAFLAQLAAVSNVSKAEMNAIIENAVIDTGGDEKEAKKLSKEMRQELVRAQSTLNDPDYDSRRSRDYNEYDDQDKYRRPPSGRPGSSRPMSGRPTTSERRRPPSGQKNY